MRAEEFSLQARGAAPIDFIIDGENKENIAGREAASVAANDRKVLEKYLLTGDKPSR